MDGSWAAMGQAAAITDVRRIVYPAPPTRQRPTRLHEQPAELPGPHASSRGGGGGRDPWLPWQGLSGLVQGLSTASSNADMPKMQPSPTRLEPFGPCCQITDPIKFGLELMLCHDRGLV